MNAESQLLKFKPKQVLFAELIREKIFNGELKKHDHLLPDTALAEKYQLNKRTVAAALNSLVEEGLLERRPRRGTVVKYGGMNSNTGNTVGLVMIGQGDVYGDLARNIARHLSEKNLLPVLISREILFDNDSVVTFMRSLNSMNSKPRGHIIDGDLRFPYEFVKRNRDDFKNMVFIIKYHHPEKLPGAKYVPVDFAGAGRRAAKHFIAGGHRHIALLAKPERCYAGPWSSVQEQFYQGFSEVLSQAGFTVHDQVFWKLLHGLPLENVLDELFSGSAAPTAIFCYDDSNVRLNLLPYLTKRGIVNDVEIIGFYNTPNAEECGFSSFSIREEKIAENAVGLLTGEFSGRELSVTPELVLRKNGKEIHAS